MSENWMEMSDEKLGQHFFTLWVILQAEKAGIKPDSINLDFVKKIKNSTLKYDNQNLDDIAIKEALSELAKDNWATGAIILKNVILRGAESIATFNTAIRNIAFLPGKRKGALKKTTKYLKDLSAAYPNESAKNLYEVVLKESMKGKTPFQYDRADGGLLLDGDNEVDLESFIKRLSKAKNK